MQHCQFPWCKCWYHCWFQATNLTQSWEEMYTISFHMLLPASSILKYTGLKCHDICHLLSIYRNKKQNKKAPMSVCLTTYLSTDLPLKRDKTKVVRCLQSMKSIWMLTVWLQLFLWVWSRASNVRKFKEILWPTLLYTKKFVCISKNLGKYTKYDIEL